MIKCLPKSVRSISHVCSLKPYKETKWLMPKGNPIGVNIYNCVAGEKVPIILHDPHIATWYSCGPTVYDAAHVGHASCYVKLDIVQRIMKSFFNIKLITAMGITNIDDKIIKRAQETQVDYANLANQYEHEFWLDMSKLGITKPLIVTKVTDYIPTIEKFVKKLLESDKAYALSDGSVYFDTSKYNNYGKLQKMQDNSESKSADKKNEMDFALWKGCKPDEPFWETEWGKGRPGWHIECSAMVSRIFGSQVDFHAGGIDLQFPHHENEETQSCAYHNMRQWTNYWVHVGHLHLKGDIKMSKSLKNTVSISELLKVHTADIFRMACLLSHYRYPMEYGDEVMMTASSVINKFKYFLKDCETYVNDSTRGDGTYEESLVEKLQKVEEIIDQALRDDFDTSKGVNTLLNLVSYANKVIKSSNGNYYPVPILLISEYVNTVLSRFGLSLSQENAETILTDSVVDTFVDFRHTVRRNALSRKDKDLLIACDIVRDRMKSFDIQINDSSSNAAWIRSK